MVAEYAILDLYHLTVEVLFGNFFLAIIAIGVIFALLMALMRTSMMSILVILVLFYVAMFVGFYGSLIGVFIFLLSGAYFAFAIVRWFQGMVGQ